MVLRLMLPLAFVVCSGCIGFIEQTRIKSAGENGTSLDKSAKAQPSFNGSSRLESGEKNKLKRDPRIPRIVSRKPLGKRDDKLVPSNDEIVNAALEKAAKIGAVHVMKICYRSEHDEWWVSLFQDRASLYDVKRFIWSMESDKLMPYLVLKRVSKTKFKEYVKKKEPGVWCEIIELSAK